MNQQKKIPEGWKEVTLGDVVNYIKGFAFKSVDYSDNGVRIIRVSDLGKNSIHNKNGSIFIKNEDAEKYLNWSLKKNDLIFTTVGSKPPQYDSIVGRVIKVDNSNIGNLLNQNAVLMRAKEKSEVNQLYIYNHFSTKKYLYFIESIIRGNANQGSITLEDLFQFSFSLPPLPEQNRIVDVLETWNKYLERLDQKIKIKKNIKKGLAQNLLTGKVRLKGFTDEWKNIKFGEICKVEKGKALSSKDLENGDYPVIAGGKTSPYSHNKFTHENVVTISASGAYAGYISYHENKIWASDCSVVEQINGKSDINFLYYFLQNKQKQIYSLQSGGAQPHIYPKDIDRIKLACPNTREQNAIADVLMAADKEIKILEKQKEIIKNQKKYLLNNLITGQIRLPEFINKN